MIGHGYRWAEVTQMSEDEERADLEHAMRVLPEFRSVLCAQAQRFPGVASDR